MGIDKETLRQVREMVRPLANRVANSVARAVVHLVSDTKKLQLMQAGALAGETIDEVEHHQPYGFSSVPLGGAEAILVFPNGDRAHAIAVAVSDRRYRPTGGQAGEVCLYTDEGDVIRLGRGHIMSLETSGSVTLAAGTVKLGSAAAIDGAIKGTSRNTAEQVFLTAMGVFATAVGGLPGMSGAATTFGTAITAFATAAGAAVSTKVKLE